VTEDISLSLGNNFLQKCKERLRTVGDAGRRSRMKDSLSATANIEFRKY
jgi:hypothetical protein